MDVRQAREYLLVGGPKHGTMYAVQEGRGVRFNEDDGNGGFTQHLYEIETCEWMCRGGSMKAEIAYLRHSSADAAVANGYALMVLVGDMIAFAEQGD